MSSKKGPNHSEEPGDMLQGFRDQLDRLCRWFWTPRPPECKAHPIEESFKTTEELTNWLHTYYGISENQLVILGEDQDEHITEVYFEDILIAKEFQMPASNKTSIDFTVDGAEFLSKFGK